jgi:hypothetical protein
MPNLDRMSVVIATILLAYGLSRFVVLPAHEISMQLPGIYLSVQINENTIIGLLVAALTATGSDWILRDPPSTQIKEDLSAFDLAWFNCLGNCSDPIATTYWSTLDDHLCD